ncbi:hypothetical protein Sa4125_03550 [Aureimonas sp. SA4125]|nr:hypothetical protein Sa4125_03550 [Aureimonas sp. SA4125]
MRLEGEADERRLAACRLAAGRIQHGLVTAMHAVEIADRNDGPAMRCAKLTRVGAAVDHARLGMK